MKKTIAILAAAALLAACSSEKNDGVKVPITFRPGVELKSPVNEAADLRDAGVGIFGSNTENAALFANTQLSYTTGWMYDPIQYWTRADHVFAAVYPYTSSSETVGSGNAVFSSEDGSLAFDFSDGITCEAPDLMYGQKSTEKGDYSTVVFDMKHAFCQLEFRVVNVSGNTVSAITDPTLTRLRYKGAASIDADGNISWTVSDDTVSGSEYAVSGTTVSNLATATDVNDETQQMDLYPSSGIMVLPQQVYAKGVTFAFTYNGTTKHYDLGDIDNVKSWEVGKKYIYTASITSSTILMNVRVIDWVTEEYDLE